MKPPATSLRRLCGSHKELIKHSFSCVSATIAKILLTEDLTQLVSSAPFIYEAAANRGPHECNRAQTTMEAASAERERESAHSNSAPATEIDPRYQPILTGSARLCDLPRRMHRL